MKEQLKRLVRRMAKHPVPERVMRGVIGAFARINPELSSLLSSRGPADGLHFPLAVREDVAGLLDQIPSETSPNERRFLYRFFSTIWSGRNDVVEIGPFLGGTSRAIALGMCDNPRVSDNAKLYTYDRFHGYYDHRRLREFLSPLVKSGIVDQCELCDLGNSAEFMDIFTRIHDGHAYYRRVVPTSCALPDRPEDLQGRKEHLRIPNTMLTDAVFVDGCKSWFGTKYFMREVCRAATPGTYFIYQDYGWHTCFWIPAFIELLRSYFHMIGYVDTTYAFVLAKPLNVEAIDTRFPDEPCDLDEDRMVDIFESLIQEAGGRNDYYAVVRHTLQKAGALAYVGQKSRAKEIITAVKKKPWAAGHEEIIAAALESPTYTPRGKILLE